QHRIIIKGALPEIPLSMQKKTDLEDQSRCFNDSHYHVPRFRASRDDQTYFQHESLWLRHRDRFLGWQTKHRFILSPSGSSTDDAKKIYQYQVHRYPNDVHTSLQQYLCFFYPATNPRTGSIEIDR